MFAKIEQAYRGSGCSQVVDSTQQSKNINIS